MMLYYFAFLELGNKVTNIFTQLKAYRYIKQTNKTTFNKSMLAFYFQKGMDTINSSSVSKNVAHCLRTCVKNSLCRKFINIKCYMYVLKLAYLL